MAPTRIVLALLVAAAACGRPALAGQAPGGIKAANIAVSSRDRVYAADQTSNSVSVVDPASGKLLGAIKLGGPLLSTLAAVYRGQSLVHGMGFAPDHKTIAVVAVGSNAVIFIDTATNAVKHTAYVGRAPHEAMWTPSGHEVWVSVRGEDYIQVLDGRTFAPLRQIKVPNGPGMTIFSPDGAHAYVCSSFSPETVVVHTASSAIVGRVQQASTFCPNIAATPDGRQVWLTLKDSGKVQVISATKPYNTLAVLETGPITNHVNFAVTPKGEQLAFVTVGGLNQVKVFTTTSAPPRLVATIDMPGANPHGLWPSGDGTVMWVGLQIGNALAAIDTRTHKVVSTLSVGGQAPMALVYVPEAVPAGTPPAANLLSADEARQLGDSHQLRLAAVGPAAAKASGAKTSAVLNRQGLVDSLEAAVTGLTPGKEYALALAPKPDGSGALEPVASLKAGPDGAASAATIGPFAGLLLPSGAQGAAAAKAALRVGSTRPARVLVVAPLEGGGRLGAAVQVQQPVA